MGTGVMSSPQGSALSMHFYDLLMFPMENPLQDINLLDV